jgi:hypothetical protein
VQECKHVCLDVCRGVCVCVWGLNLYSVGAGVQVQVCRLYCICCASTVFVQACMWVCGACACEMILCDYTAGATWKCVPQALLQHRHAQPLLQSPDESWFAQLMQQRCISTVIGKCLGTVCTHVSVTCCFVFRWLLPAMQLLIELCAGAPIILIKAMDLITVSIHVSVTCCCAEKAIVSHAAAHRALHRCSMNNYQGYGPWLQKQYTQSAQECNAELNAMNFWQTCACKGSQHEALKRQTDTDCVTLLKPYNDKRKAPSRMQWKLAGPAMLLMSPRQSSSSQVGTWVQSFLPQSAGLLCLCRWNI